MNNQERIRAFQHHAMTHPVTATQRHDTGYFDVDGWRIALALVKHPTAWGGMPTWQACARRYNRITGDPTHYKQWGNNDTLRLEAVNRIGYVLAGLGNDTRERWYRSNTTLCVHRMVTGAEYDSMPLAFHDADPIVLDSGPVEILRETQTGHASVRPCEQPGRQANTPLWEPVDCGICGPCLARRGIESERQRVAREAEAVG